MKIWSWYIYIFLYILYLWMFIGHFPSVEKMHVQNGWLCRHVPTCLCHWLTKNPWSSSGFQESRIPSSLRGSFPGGIDASTLSTKSMYHQSLVSNFPVNISPQKKKHVQRIHCEFNLVLFVFVSCIRLHFNVARPIQNFAPGLPQLPG